MGIRATDDEGRPWAVKPMSLRVYGGVIVSTHTARLLEKLEPG